MKRFAIPLSVLALVACGAADDAPPARLPDVTQTFSWTTQEKIIGFSNSARLYHTAPIAHGIHVQPLAPASSELQARANAVTYQYGLNADGSAHPGNTVDDYMRFNKATGLLVIKNGAVVLEKYAAGMNPSSLWLSWSLAKSVTSTLMGAAIQDGKIASLEDTVETYIPELKGSAYEGVRLREMLQMTSGVAWSESQLDPLSDNSATKACVYRGDMGCVLDYMKGLKRAVDDTGAAVAPGTVFHYSTGQAFLSGLVVQRATGMSLEQYLQQKIWQPYGMEADGNWWSANGVSFGGSGLSATLRDYGRFGLFILNNGVLANGTKVLPDNWVKDAITWSSASASPEYADNGQYGYMWWFNPAYDNGLAPGPLTLDIAAPLQDTDATGGAVRVQAQPASVADWTFAALGIYGQMIAINQRENLVVVQWATWDKTDPTCCDAASASYNARDPYNEEAVFLNAMIKALH